MLWHSLSLAAVRGAGGRDGNSQGRGRNVAPGLRFAPKLRATPLSWSSLAFPPSSTPPLTPPLASGVAFSPNLKKINVSVLAAGRHMGWP